MERTTRDKIGTLVRIANTRQCSAGHYTMDHNGSGWRLMVNGDSQNVSPRLTTSEMYWWLDGFVEGLTRGKDVNDHELQKNIAEFTASDAS